MLFIAMPLVGMAEISWFDLAAVANIDEGSEGFKPFVSVPLSRDGPLKGKMLDNY